MGREGCETEDALLDPDLLLAITLSKSLMGASEPRGAVAPGGRLGPTVPAEPNKPPQPLQPRPARRADTAEARALEDTALVLSLVDEVRTQLLAPPSSGRQRRLASLLPVFAKLLAVHGTGGPGTALEHLAALGCACAAELSAAGGGGVGAPGSGGTNARSGTAKVAASPAREGVWEGKVREGVREG
eukprot:CAMPEP_0180010396 /NCGR_PEP_ID=MMETSP0984-20121128/15697_1 /TAXON_ID=483367 /ORGANISM="non described non described, Strain CCMP 2436" /LENGTH=186 /DNA_ID=CAMNT_0021932153 /DNA_START=147 /DNA_END=705 /DNA_ORIENTATION=+